MPILRGRRMVVDETTMPAVKGCYAAFHFYSQAPNYYRDFMLIDPPPNPQKRRRKRKKVHKKGRGKRKGKKGREKMPSCLCSQDPYYIFSTQI